MTKNLIVVWAFMMLMPTVGIGARRDIDWNDLQFESLSWAIVNGLVSPNDGYIYERGGFLPVCQVVPETGEAVVCVNGVYALIASDRDYVDNDPIVGKYFKAAGRGSFTSSQLRAVHTVRKFRELSYKEAERVEEAKRRQEEVRAQRIYMAERDRTIKRALGEIELLTDDKTTIDNAYKKAVFIYDENYQGLHSKANAEHAVQDFAHKMIEEIKLENERRFKEWAKSHPDEYKAMLKSQEEERQRRAKAKLAAELAENAKRMSDFREFAEKFRMSNDTGLAPKSRKELQKFIGMRLVPRFDPWDCEYHYSERGSAFSISSAGPDRVIDTADDIIVNVAALAEAELPVNRRMTALRREVVEKRKILDAYKRDFIPSICGYTFGDRPAKIGDTEVIVGLARPFRRCKEAILKYEGSYDHRLVMVMLLARIEPSDYAQSQAEGARIVKLLERNYGIKIQTIQNGDCFVSSYSGDGIAIEVRNDMLLNGDDHLILSVSFRDTRLSSLLSDFDTAICSLELQEEALKQQPQKHATERRDEKEDNDGFDVLSGSASVADAQDSKEGKEIDGMSNKQVEELKAFREKMQRYREEMQRSKNGKQQRMPSTDRRKSGIIEAKSEGPVISTSNGVEFRRGSGRNSSSTPSISTPRLLRRPQH